MRVVPEDGITIKAETVLTQNRDARLGTLLSGQPNMCSPSTRWWLGNVKHRCVLEYIKFSAARRSAHAMLHNQRHLAPRVSGLGHLWPPCAHAAQIRLGVNHKRQSRCLQRQERARWHLCALSDAGSMLLMLTRVWTWPHRDTVRHRRSSYLRAAASSAPLAARRALSRATAVLAAPLSLLNSSKLRRAPTKPWSAPALYLTSLLSLPDQCGLQVYVWVELRLQKHHESYGLHERIAATARVCTDAADL